MNQPLRSAAGNAEYRLLDVNRSGGAENALVLVALSGGGKRSAAFAFGVLRGMADIPVRPERANSTLLDEIDMLAGVSGGSFPAAHFALYGRKSFDTFPEEFLYPDIEAYIWGTFLLPWNWDWIFNPLVGTNDRMTWVYDKLMFHGATFADLYRRGRPQVSINATDISFGTRSAFCRRLSMSSAPISRACRWRARLLPPMAFRCCSGRSPCATIAGRIVHCRRRCRRAPGKARKTICAGER